MTNLDILLLKVEEPEVDSAVSTSVELTSQIFLAIFLVISLAAEAEAAARNNGPMKGANLRTSVRISFEQAVFGVEKELDLNLKDTCKTCNGSGAKPGTSPETCRKCGGRGQVVTQHSTPFGTIRNSQVCPDCGGTGKTIKEKCPDCHGSGYISSRKKIQVLFQQVLITDRAYVSEIRVNRV